MMFYSHSFSIHCRWMLLLQDEKHSQKNKKNFFLMDFSCWIRLLNFIHKRWSIFKQLLSPWSPYTSKMFCVLICRFCILKCSATSSMLVLYTHVHCWSIVKTPQATFFLCLSFFSHFKGIHAWEFWFRFSYNINWKIKIILFPLKLALMYFRRK
jgi:hypothetical protein